MVLVLLGEGPVLNYGLFTGSSQTAYCLLFRHSAPGIFPLQTSLSDKVRVCTSENLFRFFWLRDVIIFLMYNFIRMYSVAFAVSVCASPFRCMYK